MDLNSTPYILMALVAGAIVVLLALAMMFRMKRERKPMSKLGAISLVFVIAGILFNENRLVGYGLIGVGLLLAVIDIFIKIKRRKEGGVEKMI
jgi:membrane-bound ClpP family serine protease